MSAAGKPARPRPRDRRRRSQSDAARHFDHASGNLEQLEAQCRELGLCQVALFRNDVADGEHLRGGVQNEADLVGERQATRRAIGGKLSFVQLDEIFGLSARAVESFIEPIRRSRGRGR